MGQWDYNEFAFFLNKLSIEQKQSLGINNIPFGSETGDVLNYDSATKQWGASNYIFRVDNFENIIVPISGGEGFTSITGYNLDTMEVLPIIIMYQVNSISTALGDITAGEIGTISGEVFTKSYDLTTAPTTFPLAQLVGTTFAYDDAGSTKAIKLTTSEEDVGEIDISFKVISIRAFPFL